jgi:hypothetical protein
MKREIRGADVRVLTVNPAVRDLLSVQRFDEPDAADADIVRDIDAN